MKLAVRTENPMH